MSETPFGSLPKPRYRPRWRRRLGRWFYRWKRRFEWFFSGKKWARTRQPDSLPFLHFQHQSPLLRRLKAVDMALQHNKVTNLRLAIERLDGLILHPGETFSFWLLVGKPSARRGFLKGLVLEGGKIGRGTGGGLCQLGNLLYWMALHTPLDVTERWRHGFDVFPDEGRTLPFGSGATLAYNYIDLQLHNPTAHDFQIRLGLSDAHLQGAIRSNGPAEFRFEVFERGHLIRPEPWGGYSRHNIIGRKIYHAGTGALLQEQLVTENHALMMYQPFLSAGDQEQAKA